MTERSKKLLTAAGFVMVIMLAFYAMRLGEESDRQEARAASSSQASECAASCERNYSSWRRRCSAQGYDGTQAWCHDQNETTRASCLSRCQR